MARRRRNPNTPNIARAYAAVQPKVARAARTTTDVLHEKGVRHLLCGGLAVAAYGFERNTKDVDFLVGDEIFEPGKSAFVSMRAGIPIEVNGIKVDYVTLPDIQAAIEHELNTNNSGVVSLPFLVYMKLIAYRPQDRTDITRLLELDADRYDDVKAALVNVLDVELTRRLTKCATDAGL